MPGRLCIFFSMLVIFSLSVSALAQTASDSGELFSPYVSDIFYNTGYELYTSEYPRPEDAEQAMVFFNAVLRLDKAAKYVLPDIISAAVLQPAKEYKNLIYADLTNYVSEDSDLEIADLAVRYLLDRMDTREQREAILAALINKVGSANKFFSSELYTQLGLLSAERADSKSAEQFLMYAYQQNFYNNLAFAKLNEIMATPAKSAFYLQHLRRQIVLNPLNLQASLQFANALESLEMYDSASNAYQYCADLYKYLYPTAEIDPSIYLPWALANYNTQRNQLKCLEIADMVRKTGRFDLMLEAVAGKAALKMNQQQQADEIFDNARRKARSFVNNNVPNQTVTAAQLAWFYCFADPDAEEALAWANQAYSADPNSAFTKAILAYALAANQQFDVAKPLAEPLSQSNQIAAVAMALVQLQQNEKELAIASLKNAIAMDPPSLESEAAKKLLEKNGSVYVNPEDTTVTLKALEGTFGQRIAPEFVSPDNAISVKLSFSGSEIPYGGKLDSYLVITNNQPDELVICEQGMFKGNFRIDAKVKGDVTFDLPNIISRTFRPSVPLVQGKALFLPVNLSTGKLRQILNDYPQAKMEVEFTVTLDPVIGPDGQPASSIPGLEPATFSIRREHISLTTKYLQNRLESLSNGQQGQKLRSIRLFAGLLAEQQRMKNTGTLYPLMQADSDLLESALVRGLSDDDWIVRLETMNAISSLTLGYQLLGQVSDNLNAPQWPLRLMALFILAKAQPKQQFQQVLDWTVKFDSEQTVRDMAIAFGAKQPEPEKEQAAQPTPQPQTVQQPNQPQTEKSATNAN